MVMRMMPFRVARCDMALEKLKGSSFAAAAHNRTTVGLPANRHRRLG